MAIEKRMVGDEAYGYDTVKKSYMKLPADMKDAPATTDYSKFTNPQLEKLAEEQGIDLGDATKKDDMITKIKEGLAKQPPAGPRV